MTNRLSAIFLFMAMIPLSGALMLFSAQAEDAGTSKSIAAQRSEIRTRLEQMSGVRSSTPKIQPGKAADYWQTLQEYEAASDPKMIWALVERHIRLAEALLEQEDEAVRRSGVGILLLVVDCVDRRLNEPQFAARICAAWLLPNKKWASETGTQFVSQDTVYKQAMAVYVRAGDPVGLAKVANDAINSTHNLNVADHARLRLAQSLVQQRKTLDAIKVLQEISDPSFRGVSKMIDQLRQQPVKQRLR